MKKNFAFAVASGLLALSCGEPPSVPTASDSDLIQSGLVRDADGIWRDTSFSKGGLPFADMPTAYRVFWINCAKCHSASGQNDLAPKARRALRLNTWKDVTAYGAEKLALAAKAGGMPPSPYPRVPDDVLTRAQAFLAAGSEAAYPMLLIDFRYSEGERFVRTYCADCHAPGGKDPARTKAANTLLLDSYGQWHKNGEGIKARLDSATDPKDIMPPDTVSPARKPSQAERQAMLDWIDRFTPNTADGAGIGDSLTAGRIVITGAMQGLVYDTAFKLINRYCADCHTQGGRNEDQPEAWNYVLRLDTYEEWAGVKAGKLQERLDWALAAQQSLDRMPPREFPRQPTNAELQILLDWVGRGSPNTTDGL